MAMFTTQKQVFSLYEKMAILEQNEAKSYTKSYTYVVISPSPSIGRMFTLRGDINVSHTQKTGFWYILGVSFKIYHMGEGWGCGKTYIYSSVELVQMENSEKNLCIKIY